ncbi:UvrD-helicase domain-containing protein [Chryseobacterium pennipullorum]|uniref:DNA 3'-5' helicase n=1 Tax=Chryseobacterium pennipullorum TaxID=2258963 RepID=A0A3D9AT78_9FLAO|nr:ATP-dependent helicase [Chryseobacterium pennipullorum]REC44601.1 ATP-dependent helicase [Chryseobacterium pennipullorum]
MLKGLNKQQVTAIEAVGNILLTACPGSGKTRTLTHKIAYELEKSVESKKVIIAVTFTNRAAEEIQRRIRDFNMDDRTLWAGTIHAFCLEWIIRPYRCYLDELKNGFSISDEYNSERIINNLKTEYGLRFFDNVSTRYLPTGEKEEVTFRELLDEYHEILAKDKLIDFDQILHYSYKLISSYPKIASILKKMFHLICVDEYQDTQQLQYSILSSIIKAEGGSCKMFIVGDSDQAIYGSLGGVAKNHKEIEYEFQETFLSKELTGNYRSNQQIINYNKNFQITDVDILALGSNAQDRAIIKYDTEIDKDNLVVEIARIIEEKIGEGIPENEICVLAPNWYLVIPMGRRLKTLLPNVKFDAVGLSPLQKNRENIWFKIARLFLVSPSPTSFIIRKRWSSELLLELESFGITLFENLNFRSKKLLKVINSISSTNTDGIEHLEDCFSQLLDRLQINLVSNKLLNEQLTSFIDGAKKRLNNPDFDMAKDIHSFRKMFKHEEGVVVNTCHGIKGEEFDTVIAFGLLHGKVPNWNENNDIAAKKLLYVICSRSKRALYLFSETGRTTQSGRQYCPTNQLTTVVYNYD